MKRLVLVLVLALAACGKGDTPAPRHEKKEGVAAQQDRAKKGFKRAEPVAAEPLEEPIGVPECDDYVKRYLACLPKMHPAVAEPIQRAIADSKRAWRGVARNEDNREALREACKEAAKSAKQALERYACDW
jgi:hypothetical protein